MQELKIDVDGLGIALPGQITILIGPAASSLYARIFHMFGPPILSFKVLQHYSVKEAANCLDSYRQTYPEEKFLFFAPMLLPLHNIRPELGDVFYIVHFGPDGKYVLKSTEADPRLMSTSQLFAIYGDQEDLFPGKYGAMLEDYLSLASSPFRTDEEEKLVWEYKTELKKAKIKVDIKQPCKRKVL